MSKYTRYYTRKKELYRSFAVNWVSWANTASLSQIELEGMRKFFKPIARRFGLTQEFVNIGLIVR